MTLHSRHTRRRECSAVQLPARSRLVHGLVAWSIATAPAYQHRGIAHQIIEHLLAQHPGVLYLTCMDYLEGLYQPFGFRTVGPAEMSPYFKRITRLAKTFLFASGTGHKLLVMKREPILSNSPRPTRPKDETP